MKMTLTLFVPKLLRCFYIFYFFWSGAYLSAAEVNQEACADCDSGGSFMHDRPKSILDFFENIKFSVDQSLFLQKKLYSNEMLQKIFSIRRTFYLVSNKNDGRFIVDEFDESDNIDDFHNIKLSAGFSSGKSGEIEGGANFLFRNVGPSFEQVVKIFGQNWKFDESPPSPHERLLPATSLNAYRRIVYLFDYPSARWSVTFSFDQAGKVSNVVLSGVSQ